MPPPTADLALVFASERGRLERLIRRIIGDPHLAEDLVQEAFLKVSRAAAGTAVEDHRGYLVRTARNLALDHRRRLEVMRPAEDSDAAFRALPDAAPNPEAVLADRQALAAAMAALARLPPRTRRAFEMHRLDGRTMAEIGRELGISVSLVCRLVHEAYTAVRDELRRADLLPGAPENSAD
ncbi:sigma-70 family RNA polymerase sigma factor [Rhodoplanes sp. TEM]|uniref:Sigma-70 family RNA polymerase sigma factor n=1 Tax=Rhodoplanes tepidamans TaxID=200616 RepID=A0ABT5JEA4_RHOTP|nr:MULTISPECIES: sigma-70 family RNA polymerase sigma factor [Rhodoplanes]MDC7787773.1 sigma-70 family RNA polymerase sigma factor [Rhodoplanes tepidamans]MDC7982664.1 sigma-70 family RNA polymerase sigma factor [Rhodoplanes sp. TEM]MDQ0357689.1 RNA polymerase sigma-70 factor (ECF subfamily) [Rhodoplanes tepidamans]